MVKANPLKLFSTYIHQGTYLWQGGGGGGGHKKKKKKKKNDLYILKILIVHRQNR